MIEKHYKTNELADLLSVSGETLRRAAMRGELAATRAGRDLLFPESAVQAWLDANRAYTGARVVPLRRQDRASTTTRRTA